MAKRNRHEGFAKAYNEATHLYIAYSATSHLFKIGVTKNISDRLRNLNTHRPNNSSDWVYITYVKIAERITGVVETQVATSLKSSNVHRPFYGKSGYCRELYSCPLKDILLPLRYRLLPEEQKELNKNLNKFTSQKKQHFLNTTYFAFPTKADNLNPSSKRKGKKVQLFKLKRNDLTPMAQMLQDKYGVNVKY